MRLDYAWTRAGEEGNHAQVRHRTETAENERRDDGRQITALQDLLIQAPNFRPRLATRFGSERDAVPTDARSLRLRGQRDDRQRGFVASHPTMTRSPATEKPQYHTTGAGAPAVSGGGWLQLESNEFEWSGSGVALRSRVPTPPELQVMPPWMCVPEMDDQSPELRAAGLGAETSSPPTLPLQGPRPA